MKLLKKLLPLAQSKEDEVNLNLIAGWQKVDSSLALDKIALYIGDDTSPVTALNTKESHSIPSLVAHIINYEETIAKCARIVREQGRNGVSAWDPAANEWLGMIAVYLLSKRLGLNITISDVVLPIPTKDDLELPELSLKQILAQKLVNIGWEANHKRLINATANDSIRLCTFCLKRGQMTYPFAVLDPKIGLCPLKQYDPAAFDGVVSWYKRENNRVNWSDVPLLLLHDQSNGGISSNGMVLLQVLQSWIGNNGLGRPQSSFRDAMEMVQRDICVRFQMTAANLSLSYVKTSRQNLPNQLDPAYLDFLDAIPDSKVPGPEQTFAEHAVLFPLTDKQYREMQRNFVRPPIPLDRISYEDTKLYMLPPIKQDIYEFVQGLRQDGTDEGKINISVRPIPDEIMGFSVSVSFPDGEGGVCPRRIQDYCLKDKNLWLLDSFPFVSLWPNVNLPEDAWQLYLLAKVDTLGGTRLQFLINEAVSDPTLLSKKHLAIVSESTQYISSANTIFQVQQADKVLVEGEEVKARIPDSDSWTLFEMKKRPERIAVKARTKTGEIIDFGILQIINHAGEIRSISQDTVIDISLDFGTSTTMCYIKDPRGARSIISGYDYVLDLVPDVDEHLKEEFCRYHWIAPGVSDNERDVLGKISTVAQGNEQMFDNSGYGRYRPYYGGRYLRMDSLAWTRLTKGKESQTLDAFYVFTGLKFPDGTEKEKREKQDARYIFFTNLLTLAALDARMLGARKARIIPAFPHLEAKQNLAKYLFGVRTQNNNTYYGGLFYETEDDLHSYTEAEAALAYFKAFSEVPLNEESGAVIVDIGGGTTDMLASYGREFRQGSINIAGDIFTRRSIVYSTARKASAGRKTHPGTEELQTMFHYNGTATEVPIAYYQTYEIKINNLQYEYPNFPPLSADGMRTKYYDMAELLDSLMQVPGIIPAFSNVTNAETLMESGILRTQAEASISLSETIKLRYMQLFYLLANWLKANRDMFKYDEMDHIRIFFAGYGVRGLGFCAGQDVMTFALDNKFLHLLKLLMQAVLETEKDIVFIQPQVTDKVEVVKGLLSSQELRRDDQLRKKSDRAPISRITEVDKKKITAAYHEIAKIFDIVFEKFNSEQNDGMGLFCERFTGLLQKAEKVGMKHEAKWLGILSELPTIFEASRRAKLSGDLSHVGAAVWGFNRALDFATAHWEATEE